MQYFGKWYDIGPFTGEFENLDVLKDFSKMGFVDYYTHGFITKPKIENPDDPVSKEWSKQIKWKEDVNNPAYFYVYYVGNNSYYSRLFFRKKRDKNNYAINYRLSCWNSPYYYFQTGGPVCIQFINLINGGFLLDICQGPSFGTETTDPIPPFSMNKNNNNLLSGDSLSTIVGLSPVKDSQSKEFIYLVRGRGRSTYDGIEYNMKHDDLTVYSDEQGSRTINTNIPNKYIMTKIPHFDGFLENLFLLTVKPASLQPDDYFTVNNKTYLLLFNNYAVEVEMEGD